jgi:hypothetical protein
LSYYGCAIIYESTTSNDTNLQNYPQSTNKESQGPGNADQNEQPDDGITEVAAAHLAKLTLSAFSLFCIPSNTRFVGGLPGNFRSVTFTHADARRGRPPANVNLTGLGVEWFIPDHAPNHSYVVDAGLFALLSQRRNASGSAGECRYPPYHSQSLGKPRRLRTKNSNFAHHLQRWKAPRVLLPTSRTMDWEATVWNAALEEITANRQFHPVLLDASSVKTR